MQINADFSLVATAHADALPWVPSPMAGVERRMLERIGGELARATSLVRYAPRSRFAEHVHTGGEEFLVLEGVFSDEAGDYGPGSYVRNPPGSRHAPSSRDGCTIFVKLWQFALSDQEQVRIDVDDVGFVPAPGRPGVEVKSLFDDAHERVRIERWAPRSVIELPTRGGFEALLLSGSYGGRESFTRYSWLRVPPDQPFEVHTRADAAIVWVKQGHLVSAAERFHRARRASGL